MTEERRDTADWQQVYLEREQRRQWQRRPKRREPRAVFNVDTATVDELQAAVRQGLSTRHIQEFEVWQSMRRKCLNVKHSSYKRYGGRGIKICDQWRESFWRFLRDVGRRPGRRICDLRIFTLEMIFYRLDEDGDFEPGNVRWISISEKIRRDKSLRVGHRRRLSADLVEGHANLAMQARSLEL